MTFITFLSDKLIYNLLKELIKEGEFMTQEKEKQSVEKQGKDNHSHLNLKGTFMMVMALGGLMLISWFGAFILFMERM